MKNIKKLVVCSLLFVSFHSYAGKLGSDSFFGHRGVYSPEVVKMNEAFIAKKWVEMSTHMKAALEAQPDDSIVLENILSTLRKSYELVGKDGVPTDWKLPDEVLKMRISVDRIVDDIPKFRIKIFGNVTELGIFRQIQIKRFPDEVILDKAAQIGFFKETAPKRPTDKFPEFEFEASKTRFPVKAGLYLLKIILENGSETNGWFLIDENQNASSSPKIVSPEDGETVKTATPTLKWVNFVSPEYQPFERRTLWTGISRSEPPKYEWDEKWSMWEGSPMIETATVDSPLENGRYVFVVLFHELRRFGDISIGRSSKAYRAFKVQK